VSPTSQGPGGAKSSVRTESGPTSPLAIVVGLGALGVLLVILFFRSTPAADLAPEQRTLAMALVEHMQSKGVLIRYSCADGKAYVTKALWDNFNSEQKRGLTIGLATVCYGEHEEYRAAILDVDSRQRLANFDGSAFTIP
jgi:hypothetical protein